MPSATSKRPRRTAFEDEDEEGVVVAKASSSLRNDRHIKKPRVSVAGPSKSLTRQRRDQSESASESSEDQDDDENEDEDEDEDEEMQDPQQELDVEFPSATQYELLRDDGFKHLNHAEEDDQRATQRLKNRPELVGENHVALNAVIESIEVFNFMCHTRLKVELGPLLNFIVGENGSGKSAILTAITLCLGGKASSTNRGAALKSFIKEGQDHARLVVKIKNQGPDAFKPELYGETITVERNFSRSSSSGFKLKSTGGKVISTKKDDVNDVVEYYCLQVDNPLNVLSQDNARQFLNSATPATKYRYFLQGTQLQQLNDDLLLFSDSIDQTETKLEQFGETVDLLKSKLAKAQKMYDTVSKSDEMQHKVKVYRNQLAWAQVVEQEMVLKENEEAIAAAEREVLQMEEICQEKSDALAKQDERIVAAKEALEDLRQEEPLLSEKRDEAQAEYEAAKASVQGLHTQEREVHEQFRAAVAIVKSCTEKIKDEEKRLEDADGGAVAVKQKALEDARQAVEDAVARKAEHGSNKQRLADEFSAAETNIVEASSLIEQKRKEVNAAEAHIRSLSQNRGDPMAAYIQQMPQLLKLIDQDRGFRDKPIGPLGMHIQLLKPEWSLVLERVLGGGLDAFIVSHRDDQLRLSELMHRARFPDSKISIFISRSGRSLGNIREPEESFDTILRVLKFDDERVKNQFIITNHIEQIILVPNRNEGERIMFESRPPLNVHSCLSFHDVKKGEGIILSNRGGNLGSTPVSTDKPHQQVQKPRMKSDTEYQINHQKEILAQLQSELRDLESERRQLQQVAQKCSRAVTDHKKKAQKLDLDIRQAELAVRNAEEELDEFDGLDMKLQGLREELRVAEEKEEHYGHQYGGLAVVKEEHNKAVSAARKVLADAKAECGDFKSREAKAEDKVNRYEAVRRTVLAEKNGAYEDLAVGKEAKKKAERTRDRQLDVLQDHKEGAAQVCPEREYIPEGESYPSIERKYNAIREQLKKFHESIGLTKEQASTQLADAGQECTDAEKGQKNLLSLMVLLKKALITRLDKWRMFQRMISASARVNFEYLLSERGFRGRLLLDHKAKKLDIKVEPDETRKNMSGRNTKTLSGGEKSFSSICLLLAIWDAMGSPLRCLDEFDVFMDQVNRGISTKMLIQAARRSVGKQFILITPNAIQGHNAASDKDVKIIRLTDPRQKRIDA